MNNTQALEEQMDVLKNKKARDWLFQRISFRKAALGNISQFCIKEVLEKDRNISNFRCGQDEYGEPDFIYEYRGKEIRHEHKRADTKSTKGIITVDYQKTRRTVPERLYLIEHCDVVSVDVSLHTGKINDFRYTRSKKLRKHHEYKDRAASTQCVNNWKSSLLEALNE